MAILFLFTFFNLILDAPLTPYSFFSFETRKLNYATHSDYLLLRELLNQGDNLVYVMKGGRRFHKRCFKCSTCSKKLDSTTVRCVFWTPPRSGAFSELYHGQVPCLDSTKIRCVFSRLHHGQVLFLNSTTVRFRFLTPPRSGAFSELDYDQVRFLGSTTVKCFF